LSLRAASSDEIASARQNLSRQRHSSASVNPSTRLPVQLFGRNSGGERPDVTASYAACSFTGAGI
jgi:hypothetical protein